MENRGRVDPYKNFNFQIAFGTALAAIAGFAFVKKLFPGVADRYRKKDNVIEVPASSKPIEGVGTSVAAKLTPKPRPKTKRPSGRSAGMRASPKKRGGPDKRR